MENPATLKQEILQSTVSAVKSHAEADLCVICLDRITEKALAFPCRHESFDFICLASWLHEKATCPLCKASVKAVQYGFGLPTGPNTFNPASAVKPPLKLGRNPRSRPHGRPRGRRSCEERFRGPRTSSGSFSDDQNIAFRKHVYQHRLRCLHVGSNRISQYQDFTPASFAKHPQMESRARKWIRRELQVFEFLSLDATSTGPEQPSSRITRNAEFLLDYIIAVIKSVDLKGSSGQAEELLHEFLGRENCRIFIHELEAWLRSPYDRLEDWDRMTQYDTPGSKT